MSSPSLSNFRTQSLDHLGLVAGMCKELGIAELVDRMLPPNPRGKVTHGQRVVAMLLNGLGFASRTLYLTPEFLAKKPIERLIAPGLKADFFNDDALGRTLDALHKHDVTQLYVHIAAHAVKTLGLRGKSVHLDSTSFHLDGKYNRDNPPEEDDRLIHITRGHSRDGRPDLNQVILHLISENKAGIPLLMKAVSGNQIDQKAFKNILKKHLSQLKQASPLEYVVADAALFTRENIQALHGQVKFITRMPGALKEAKRAIDFALQSTLTSMDDKLSFLTLSTRYADVPQRMVVVFSSEKFKRDTDTLEKRVAKQSKEELKQFKKLTRQEFAHEKDAEQALRQCQKKCKWLEFTDVRIPATKRYKKAGRPSANSRRGKNIYHIQATTCVSKDKKKEAFRTMGYFVLVTNELDEKKMTAADVIREYKNQVKVERGFRFLKDPLFIAREFYVKKVERLMALTFVMTLCLLVYAACEHRLRTALQDKDLGVPDQKKKATKRPTIRWVFQFFVGIDLLVTPGGNRKVLNLKPQHLVVLRALGPPFEKMYV